MSKQQKRIEELEKKKEESKAKVGPPRPKMEEPNKVQIKPGLRGLPKNVLEGLLEKERQKEIAKMTEKTEDQIKRAMLQELADDVSLRTCLR